MKIKYISFWLLCSLFFITRLSAQEGDFQEGLDLLEEGQKEETMALWDQWPLQDRATYEWVANMAMVQELTENYIEAKMKWLYLQKLYGPDFLIEKRLTSLNKELGIIQNEPAYFWGFTFKGSLVSGKIWVSIMISLGLLSIVLLLWSRNLKTFKKSISTVRVSVLFLFLGVLIQWIWQNYQLKHLPEYVLVSTQHLDYENQETIHWPEGSAVLLLERVSGTQVKVKNRLGEQAVLPESAIRHFEF